MADDYAAVAAFLLWGHAPLDEIMARGGWTRFMPGRGLDNIYPERKQ